MKLLSAALLPGCLLLAGLAQAQAPTTPTAAPNAPYQPSSTKTNDLVHTKLAVRFDYAKRYLYGQEWVTLKPHAIATDTLRLDAQGMDIKTVALMNGTTQKPLKFDYSDKNNLHINLGRLFKPGEEYIVYIEYTAKPDELQVQGSQAITDAKGLYFINPDSAVAGKPVQIWTQGETQSSSAWFPTIDRPNQKTTEEIAMTVPAKYVTLSNGKLVSQVPAGPGLRTDTWKMDLPHSPYLFMMAVGDFKIYKDTWRGKEVNYYLEPKYAPFAKQIFGNTPDMLEFFSERLGVEYPWNKYAQIVARDYVSGAMENTSATLHGEQVQMDGRELLDREYSSESVIAHELFHQWFGDYVTAESWSNITVNESMADFSEALYAQHKYGQDAADAHNYRYLKSYLGSPRDATKDLVRFHYNNREDVFDLVSYQKGGAIVQMLRTYLGDDVFFAGLKKYLTDNKFGNGEAHQMRLAMEAVSGQDLNWFYNQWYFGSGQPVVSIDYAWNAASKTQNVTIKQTQADKVFRLPLAIDYYVNGKAQRQNITMTQATQTFSMALAAKPDLVNVDADKFTLWQKTDNKPVTESLYQYSHAPLYVDRREALDAALALQTANPAARAVVLAALKDTFYGLRIAAINGLKLDNAAVAKAAAPTLRKLAATDPETHVRAAALVALGQLKDRKDSKLLTAALSSQSYGIQSAGLQALSEIDAPTALARAKTLETDEHLAGAVTTVYALHGGQEQWNYIRTTYDAASGRGRYGYIQPMLQMLGRLDDPTAFAEDVDRLQKLAMVPQLRAYGLDKRIVDGIQKGGAAQAGKPNAAKNQATAAAAVQAIQAAK
ncbi:M1 family metallopeptidase [Hymenobacter sp. H14-R3]|uniref:M1 family metallopeptidase n=1 Tax=Hymenobacter sp. H14-R3 TaxID=3046308 RepID=UPI0024B8EBBD|nr:M1 family metallopeptidase [Hymenobacter sp. H14-R3]MDJ0366625.1 M1 family metallopeptidase [Hymenobacter sp. H14-R3]